MGWVRLTFDLDRESAEATEALLEPFGPLSLTMTDAGDDPVLEPAPGEAPLWTLCRLEALFDPGVDISGLVAALTGAGHPDVRLDFLDDADWQNRWRQHAVDFCFADRLWLVPRDATAPGEPALHLDPGLAFGSGSHPTTRLCLDWLARAELSGASVLDYGCGSGILALAALKLGAQRVLAIDHDPQALLATQENAAYNALGNGKAGGRLDVGTPGALGDKSFDVAVANILANPLIELSTTLVAALEPDGVLILSGLMEDQAESVMAAYPLLDFLPVVFESDEQGRRWARLEGRRNTISHGR